MKMRIKVEYTDNQSNTLLCVLDWDLLKNKCLEESKIYENNTSKFQFINQKKIDILAINFSNRQDMLTPWSAKSLKENSLDFKGLADKTTLELNKIIGKYKKDKKIIFVGFSLSALFILYNLLNLQLYKDADYAFISPSAWYPDFMNFVREKSQTLSLSGRILIIAGCDEGANRPYPLSKNSAYIDEIYSIFSKKFNCVKRIFPAGHHDFMLEKINLVFDWILTD